MQPVPNCVPDRPIQKTTRVFHQGASLLRAGNWQRFRSSIDEMDFLDRAWTKAKLGGDGLRLTKSMPK